MEKARAQVAGLLNRRRMKSSGGPESNNHAIKGVARLMKGRGRHIITSAIEHPAVLNVCRFLENEGFHTSGLQVDDAGMVSVLGVENAIRPETILISLMHANNETGEIQSIAEIADLALKHDVQMHTDAAQSMGKIPTDVQTMKVALLSVAGHGKRHAHCGVGGRL